MLLAYILKQFKSVRGNTSILALLRDTSWEELGATTNVVKPSSRRKLGSNDSTLLSIPVHLRDIVTIAVLMLFCGNKI